MLPLHLSSHHHPFPLLRERPSAPGTPTPFILALPFPAHLPFSLWCFIRFPLSLLIQRPQLKGQLLWTIFPETEFTSHSSSFGSHSTYCSPLLYNSLRLSLTLWPRVGPYLFFSPWHRTFSIECNFWAIILPWSAAKSWEVPLLHGGEVLAIKVSPILWVLLRLCVFVFPGTSSSSLWVSLPRGPSYLSAGLYEVGILDEVAVLGCKRTETVPHTCG